MAIAGGSGDRHPQDGVDFRVVADRNLTGGALVIHRVTIPSGASVNLDQALTHLTRVFDAVVVLKGAGTAGSTVTISNVTTAITDAVDVSAGADKAIFRFATWDDAQQEIVATANLRVSSASTSADFPGAEVYVYGMRV